MIARLLTRLLGWSVELNGMRAAVRWSRDAADREASLLGSVADGAVVRVRRPGGRL